MRIAITTDQLDPERVDGAGRVVLEMARRLAGQGAEVAVVAGDHRCFSGHRAAAGLLLRWEAFPIGSEPGRRSSSLLRRRAEIRRAWARLPFRPDRIIHHRSLTAWAIGSTRAPQTFIHHAPWPLEHLAARFGEGSLTRLGEHGPSTRWQVALRRRLEHRALSRAERIICLTPTSEAALRSVHGDAGAREGLRTTVVRAGGVDLEHFRPLTASARRAIREHHEVPPDGLLLCAVRRMVPHAGLDSLLHALAGVGDALGRWRLVISGDGPMRNELIELATALRLSDRVRFPGHVPDAELPQLYGASDLTLVPTRTLEGYGRSTLESLACGTPVIATPMGGSTGILGPLDRGLLTTESGPRGLAERLGHWAERREELANLRARCRGHAARQGGWERLIEAALEGSLVLD